MNVAKTFLRRTVRPALLSAAVLLTVTSCFVTSENIGDFGPGTAVSRLTGTSGPREPGDAVFATLTEDDYRASLRRVIVTYGKWISLVRTEPRPLFSDGQIADFALALEREMAGLRPDQRIEFRFKESFRNLEVQVEIYKEGEFLVFRFEKLAGDPNTPVEVRPLTTNQAALAPQAGQTIEVLPQAILLREPARPAAVISAQAQQRIIDLITRAFRNGRITEEARERLLEFAAASPDTEIEAFRQHIRKRQTLRKANRQGLITTAELRDRMERLESGLHRPAAGEAAEGGKGNRNRGAQLQMIRSAFRGKIITRSEKERLESLVERSPAPSLERLRTFLDKRETLQQAREQELLTGEEFRTRVERLTEEISR